MLAESWADGAYHGPPDPRPCTANDPRCQRIIEAQAALYKQMKDAKAHAEDWELGHQYLKTDVAETFAGIRRVTSPAVQLVKRKVQSK